MKLILHHSQGNANVRASAVGFAEAGLLAEFHTSIACFQGSLLDSIAGVSFFSEIRRRRFDPLLKPFTHTSPAVEVGRLLSLRAGFNKFTKPETGIFCVEAAIRSLDKKVAGGLKNAKKNGIGAVYAYEDGALFSFQEARQLGLKCFYDLPTGYWRAKLRILEEEKRRFPEWQNTIPGLYDSTDKLAHKDEEIKMADRIFVASRFTASTLKDFPGKLPAVQVIPYGFPAVGTGRDYIDHTDQQPVKLLFVGSLSQQKGIANLFKAVEAIGNSVSLTVIGRKGNEDCPALNAELAKHRWIPSLPHHDILSMMREHDVLVFPTLFDGFGLVISEAMSQGTPVIATFNSGGPDIIKHGENGWLVEAGATAALQATIEALVKNPAAIIKAGRAAMETARLRPWEVFKQELADAIKQ